MESNKLILSTSFMTMKFVHFSLVASVVFFAGISVVFHFKGSDVPDGAELNLGFEYLVPVFAFMGIAAGNWIFKYKLKKCVLKTELKEKLNYYRSALLVKYAFVEVACFISVLAYDLVNNLVYLGIAGMLLAVLLYGRPTADKMADDLGLNQEERSMLTEKEE